MAAYTAFEMDGYNTYYGYIVILDCIISVSLHKRHIQN